LIRNWYQLSSQRRYPGAHHDFDLEILRFEPGVNSKSHWLQYDDAATKAAINRVRSFLGRTLGDDRVIGFAKSGLGQTRK
jgi:hypothetical protein